MTMDLFWAVVFVLSVAVSITVAHPDICRYGNFFPPEKKCYFKGKGNYNWTDAEQLCNLRGGTLAKVENDATDSFLLDNFYLNLVFIGLNDRTKEWDWRWTDNTPLNPSFNKWHVDSPGHTGDCATYWRNNSNVYGWLHYSCHTKRESLCEANSTSCVYANGGCQHDCKHPSGAARVCSCHPGYSKYNDSRCDIDECALDGGYCSRTQVCKNTNGSYTCLSRDDDSFQFLPYEALLLIIPLLAVSFALYIYRKRIRAHDEKQRESNGNRVEKDEEHNNLGRNKIDVREGVEMERQVNDSSEVVPTTVSSSEV